MVLFHQSSELVEKLGALSTGGFKTPGSVEGLLGSLDGEVDILLGTLRDGGDELSVGRVDDTVREKG